MRPTGELAEQRGRRPARPGTPRPMARTTDGAIRRSPGGCGAPRAAASVGAPTSHRPAFFENMRQAGPMHDRDDADASAAVTRGMRAQLSRREEDLAAGAAPVGWKIGFNTPAIQEH